MTSSWLAAVFALGLAHADPADTLDPAARQLWETAVSMEQAGQYKKAIAGYRLVLSRDPVFVPAVLGLGRSLESSGDVAGAVAAYSRLSTEPDAVEAMARIVEPRDPAKAAALYGRLQTLRLGDPWPHLAQARALVTVDPIAAAGALDTYLGLVDGEPDGVVLIDVAGSLREAGREEDAVALLERYLAEWPEGLRADEARGRLDRMSVERAARALAVGGSEPLGTDGQRQVDEARRAAVAGDLDGALADLREVVREAPRSAEARGALGDVHLAMGAVDEAERAYAWAVALEPDESAWHARMGMLLAERYGGRRHREAAEELNRALGLRPSQAELHVQLGRVHQGLGAWDDAVKDYESYLVAAPTGAFADEASQALADLRRPPPALSDVAGPAAVEPTDVPEAAWDHYRVARVYRDRGEREAARVELAQAIVLAPRWPAALNLQAGLDLQDGDEDAAIATWERSLTLDGGQPRVRLTLGEVYRRRGDEGRATAQFEQAAADGAADASYWLAADAFENRRVFEARRKLDTYFAASTGGLNHEPAVALARRVDRAIDQMRYGVGGGLGVVVLAGGLALARRMSGAPLSALLQRAPESAHDVARVLSAIRHEVLKHNTTLLGEMAAALENGDLHAVAWAADRLFGDDGVEPGIVDRFAGYLAELERLGRRHGLRLDLEHKDPVLAPMRAGMKRLRRLERSLRSPPRAERPRAALAAELEGLSELLNERSYRALGAILREMGALQVDRAMLAGIDARVRAEPGFAGQVLPTLQLDLPVEVLAVRVFRGDLADIVANILRNAYRALVDGVPEDERRIGLALAEESDPITGLESIALRFRDSAPGPLTDAMIKGRSIGRGLGLAVDLITRHDGSITVEAEPGWAKAVVVRLARAESGPAIEAVVEEEDEA